MMLKLCFILAVLAVGILTLRNTAPDWTYMIVSIEFESSNPSAANCSARPNRISPGVYGLSGTFDLKVDLDDSYTTETEILYSSSGSSQYSVSPFKASELVMSDFMNIRYKKYLMKYIQNCSNFPVFEEKFIAPFPANKYIANKCLIDNKDLPSHMNSGYYKILWTLKGPQFEAHVELIIKIYSKLAEV